jgi:hypothetical protein
MLATSANAVDAIPQAVFGGAQVQEIYRIRLDRGDLLLESIDAAIKEYGIQDGLRSRASDHLRSAPITPRNLWHRGSR